jgi:hypothetical protein
MYCSVVSCVRSGCPTCLGGGRSPFYTFFSVCGALDSVIMMIRDITCHSEKSVSAIVAIDLQDTSSYLAWAVEAFLPREAGLRGKQIQPMLCVQTMPIMHDDAYQGIRRYVLEGRMYE